MRSRGRTRNENHQVSDVTRKVAVDGSLSRVQETASAFHQLAQRIAFRDHDARQQSRSFASWNQYPAIRGQVLLRRQGGDDFLKTWIAAQRIPKRIETFKREQ